MKSTNTHQIGLNFLESTGMKAPGTPAHTTTAHIEFELTRAPGGSLHTRCSKCARVFFRSQVEIDDTTAQRFADAIATHACYASRMHTQTGDP